LTLLMVVLTYSMVGCTAADKHVFVSTVHRPTSIALVDTNANEAVWEMDIPVNHMLELDFEGTDRQQADASGAPSWVNWKLYRVDDQPVNVGEKRHGVLVTRDKIDLTGRRIRMQVNYRPAPEMPGSVDAAPVPVQETAQSVAAEAVAEVKAQQQDEAVETAADEAEVDSDTEHAQETAQGAGEQASEEATDAMEEVTTEVETADESSDEAMATEATDKVEEAVEESSSAEEATK